MIINNYLLLSVICVYLDCTVLCGHCDLIFVNQFLFYPWFVIGYYLLTVSVCACFKSCQCVKCIETSTENCVIFVSCAECCNYYFNQSHITRLLFLFPSPQKRKEKKKSMRFLTMHPCATSTCTSEKIYVYERSAGSCFGVQCLSLKVPCLSYTLALELYAPIVSSSQTRGAFGAYRLEIITTPSNR